MEKSLSNTQSMTSSYFRTPKMLSGEAFSWLNHTEDPRHILDPLLRQLIQSSAPAEKVAQHNVRQSLKRLSAACDAEYGAILKGDSSGGKIAMTLLPISSGGKSVVERPIDIAELGPIRGVLETGQSRIWSGFQSEARVLKELSLENGIATPFHSDLAPNGALALLKDKKAPSFLALEFNSLGALGISEFGVDPLG
ncbi:MAG: hypothetical protein P1V97_05995 [Planctomycetota bacterium]|nr:hypothetical protein [Planctomycetota bacterium]